MTGRAVLVLSLLLSGALSAQDYRYGAPQTLQGSHPFLAVESVAAWEERKAAIRERVLLAAGLIPMPTKVPLEPVRGETVRRGGFQVTPVRFESFPGHWVTGSLFEPLGESRVKRPGVLCPHGHWENARFYDLEKKDGIEAVKKQIAIGAERFEIAARNPLLARCVQLARMGCVVLFYDMIGSADSIQFAEHRRGLRPEMNGREMGKWGFVSHEATLRLQTNFGLQTWNSVRALDFLSGLETVDPDRILVTGASGGATQTMMLAAIDDRVDAAFPTVMASTAMQGGCTCENSHYLRIGQGNIDIAAVPAPKPLGLTAADDWTVALEVKGHPDLVGLYRMLKARENYEAHFNTHFRHNFNHVSRSQLYRFANQHLGLGIEEPVLERDFAWIDEGLLTIWPEGLADGIMAGDEHERALNGIWATDSDRQVAVSDDLVRRGWKAIVGREFPHAKVLSFEIRDDEVGPGLRRESQSIGIYREGFAAGPSGDTTIEIDESLLVDLLRPENEDGSVVIDLDRATLDRVVPDDREVIVRPELFGLGYDAAANREVIARPETDPDPESWQRSPVYFYGYNDSVFVRRVHDLLATVAWLRTGGEPATGAITIRATGEMAAVAMVAGLVAGDAVDHLEVDLDGFRFSGVTGLYDDAMVPGAVKYGDVEGLLRVTATQRGRD